MWIALGILAFLAILVAVVLSLPVKIIIRNNDQNELILRYKFLFKTFGENPNPDDPIVKALTSASGITRLKKERLQENIRSTSLQKTVSETYDLLIDLLKEVVGVLRRCTVSKLHIKIRCVGDGADEAAIHYGQCVTVTYSLLNILRNFLRIRKRGCKIDIGCDHFGSKAVFRYDVILTVRAGRVLSGLWEVIMAETKRTAKQQENQQK